jgi:hypothetical protein
MAKAAAASVMAASRSPLSDLNQASQALALARTAIS